MRSKLKLASQKCFDEGKMTEEEKHKYFMSGKFDSQLCVLLYMYSWIIKNTKKKLNLLYDLNNNCILSVTEEEIEQGILKSPGNPLDHCLCFVRIIEDIHNNLGHSKVWRYIDMTGNEINQESQTLLNQLRENRIPKIISKDKIQT